jgi:hypothetical protein
MKMKIGSMLNVWIMVCWEFGMIFFIVKNVQKVLNILARITCDFDQKTLQDCVNNFHL